MKNLHWQFFIDNRVRLKLSVPIKNFDSFEKYNYDIKKH